jgi:hypothetical protein
MVEMNGIEHARPVPCGHRSLRSRGRAICCHEAGDTPAPPWSTVRIPFSTSNKEAAELSPASRLPSSGGPYSPIIELLSWPESRRQDRNLLT